jgi:hypothetical protein
VHYGFEVNPVCQIIFFLTLMFEGKFENPRGLPLVLMGYIGRGLRRKTGPSARDGIAQYAPQSGPVEAFLGRFL